MYNMTIWCLIYVGSHTINRLKRKKTCVLTKWTIHRRNIEEINVKITFIKKNTHIYRNQLRQYFLHVLTLVSFFRDQINSFLHDFVTLSIKICMLLPYKKLYRCFTILFINRKSFKKLLAQIIFLSTTVDKQTFRKNIYISFLAWGTIVDFYTSPKVLINLLKSRKTSFFPRFVAL